MRTDTYEAITTACLHEEKNLEKGVPSKHQARLYTESTTDLSQDSYNYSDDDGNDIHSCSDTEASFFVPHVDMREWELEKRHSPMNGIGFHQEYKKYRKESEPKEHDLHRLHISTSFVGDSMVEQDLEKSVDYKLNLMENKTSNSLPIHEKGSRESSENFPISLAKPLLKNSSRSMSSCSFMSEDSLEE